VEIHVPHKPHVVKANDPKTDPNYRKAVALGQRRIREGKHKVDPEHREEYNKRLRGNPLNVDGIPAFLPPLHIRSAMTDVKASRECTLCGGCAIARDQYVCPKCGNYVKPIEDSNDDL
jgi:hypothetical protein